MIGIAIPELEKTSAMFRDLNQQIGRVMQSFQLPAPRLIPASLPVDAASDVSATPAEQFGAPVPEPPGVFQFPDLAPILLPGLGTITDSLAAISARIDQATSKLSEGVGALTGALDRFNAQKLAIVIPGVTAPLEGGPLFPSIPAVPGADGKSLADQLQDALDRGLAAATFVIETRNPVIIAGAFAVGAATSLALDNLPSGTGSKVKEHLQHIGQISKEDFADATTPQQQGEIQKRLLDELGAIQDQITKTLIQTHEMDIGRNGQRIPNIQRQVDAVLQLDTLRKAYQQALAHIAEVLGPNLPDNLKSAPQASQQHSSLSQGVPLAAQIPPKEFKARIELVMTAPVKIDARRVIADPDFAVDFSCGINRVGTGLA